VLSRHETSLTAATGGGIKSFLAAAAITFCRLGFVQSRPFPAIRKTRKKERRNLIIEHERLKMTSQSRSEQVEKGVFVYSIFVLSIIMGFRIPFRFLLLGSSTLLSPFMRKISLTQFRINFAKQSFCFARFSSCRFSFFMRILVWDFPFASCSVRPSPCVLFALCFRRWRVRRVLRFRRGRVWLARREILVGRRTSGGLARLEFFSGEYSWMMFRLPYLLCQPAPNGRV
jgi:hypothetical protein